MTILAIELSNRDLELLTAVFNSNSILTRGSFAMRAAKLKPEEMVQSVGKLTALGLLKARGEQQDDEVMVQYAMLEIPPSSHNFIGHKVREYHAAKYLKPKA